MHALLSGLLFVFALAVVIWLMRWSNRPVEQSTRDLSRMEEQTGAGMYYPPRLRLPLAMAKYSAERLGGRAVY
jgi:hypothetical protein